MPPLKEKGEDTLCLPLWAVEEIGNFYPMPSASFPPSVSLSSFMPGSISMFSPSFSSARSSRACLLIVNGESVCIRCGAPDSISDRYTAADKSWLRIHFAAFQRTVHDHRDHFRITVLEGLVFNIDVFSFVRLRIPYRSCRCSGQYLEICIPKKIFRNRDTGIFSHAISAGVWILAIA